MNIQPITYNNITMEKAPKKLDPNSFFNRIKQKVINAAPETTFKDGENQLKQWTKFDEKMSRPAENRGVMGATALILQPAIDASNKRVDNETRQISIYRTIAKIIAGTGVGMLVRGSSYGLVKNMTDVNSTKSYGKKLLPKKYIEELTKNPKLLKNYRSALSTGIAIGAMCVTNFVLDAPITVFLTNRLTEAAHLKNKNFKEAANAKRA